MTFILLFLVSSWLVCRAVDWLPKSMERDDAAWLDAARSGQAYHSPSVWLNGQTFFAGLPPVNIYSAVAILGIGAITVGLWLSQIRGPALILWFVFGSVLVTLALVDYRTRLLPDILTLPMIWLGLLIQLLPETRTVGLEWALIGAVAGYLPLWLLAHMYRLFRGRDGLGMGDLKLLAAMGAWSGPLLLPSVLFFAALFAIASYLIGHFLNRNTPGFHEERPFGPWIVLAYGALLLIGG
jgi:general secretion pathway protein O